MDIHKNSLPSYQRKDLEHVSADMRPTDHDYDRYVFLIDLFRRLEYDESAIGKQCPFLVIDPMFNSILARANQSLARLAQILGEPYEEILYWEEQTSTAIKERLWCPDNKMFYPYDLVSDTLIFAETSSGFTPLFAGAASRDQAEVLYSRLNSVSFCALHQGNCYTIPNYDTQKEDFDRSNYWRGPVWINVNFILAEGLARYGYTLKADNLRRDLLQLPIRFGFYEYFDSFSGKGYGSDNFSWTAALFITLVQEYYQKTGISKPFIDVIRRFTTRGRVLNSGSETLPRRTEDLAGELMKDIRRMRDGFYNTERGLVDYDAIRDSKAFSEYRALTNELRTFDLSALAGHNERLAFWINLYNTLVVDGIVSLAIERSVLDFPGFFQKTRYEIGGRIFSLSDMEHGILRGNRHPPFYPFRPFHRWDRRRRWSIRQPDPRIHFALVCGSRSCAPIEYYDPQRINDQLDEAARSFINSTEVLVFPEENRLMLSDIFRWYEVDFGGRGGVVEFISRYLAEGASRDYLVSNNDRLSFEYLFYDWDLNRWGR
jgi:hypothetical protein